VSDHPFGDPVPGEAVAHRDFNPTDGYSPHGEKQFARRSDGKFVRIDDLARKEPIVTHAIAQGPPKATPPAPQPAPSRPMNVYECIVAVSQEMAREGISKDRSNQQQGYKFRGIDDVLNALSPLLARYRLVILPRILSRTVVERQTQKGGVLFYVTVEAEFDFVSAADGSKHTVKTYGEAMDSADKATNKAMSAAYKYAAFQTFCIPTEGDNDADAVTHDVRPATTPAPSVRADAERENSAAATRGNRGTSDDGPHLTEADLPPGSRRILRVGPGYAGAVAELTFNAAPSAAPKASLLTYKEHVKALAEQLCQNREPCFVTVKRSQTGNFRVEDLVRVPADYDPPEGLPQVELGEEPPF
jgi:hypothetical protein